MLAARACRPQSAANARGKSRRRLTRHVAASWISHHQKRRTIRRIDHAVASKAGLGVSADRASIVRIGIGHDARNSRCQQRFHELPDETRAMAAPDHIGVADKLIDAACPGGLRAETLVPGAECVALDIAKRMAAKV